MESLSNCLYRFLEWKKLATSNLLLYCFLHKSWIWRTLGHVINIFSNCHFHNASKDLVIFFSNFMHWFKSAILAIFQFLQNGTFESMHEIWIFWPKAFIWSIMTMEIRKIFITYPRVRQIQDLCRKKYKKGDFLKKPSRKTKIFFCFRFE